MKYNVSLCLFFVFAVFSLSAQTAHVYFKTDQSALEPKAQNSLDSLFSTWVLSATDTLSVICHCDSRADSAYNYALSMKRAKRVQHYIRNKGIAVPMEIVGLGESVPQFANDQSTRYKNRRCDIQKKHAAKRVGGFTEKAVSSWTPGLVLRLDSLEFVGNQAVPNAYSMPVLYKLFAIMKQYPELTITLQGHVCCGDDMPLSIARAKAVNDYLQQNGIAASRLHYEGFSNYRPLANENDEAGEQRNRRVEIRVENAPGITFNANSEEPKVFSVPLRDVAFKPNTNQLTPTAAYNLALVAEMIAESTDYLYEIAVYAPNKALQQKRFQKIRAFFSQRGIPQTKVKVKPGQDHSLRNSDVLILEVNLKHK